MQITRKRGQSTVAVAVLIIAMLVFIIVYLLSLPPSDRERLLNITEGDGKTGRTVRVTVEVDEFFLEPDKITVEKGDRVIITFENVGRKTITCEVPEFDEKTDKIDPDDSDSVSFIADKRGRFEFFCKVEGRSGKIEGELKVE